MEKIISINEDILAQMRENALEALLQERIAQSITRESVNKIKSATNELVCKFAQERNMSIYDVCLNFVPKVAYKIEDLTNGYHFPLVESAVITLVPVRSLKK